MADNEESDVKMEFDDLGDDSVQAGEEIPKEIRKLRTQAYDKAVNDLVEMIHGDDLVINPDYQRNYIWDTKRASLLVESILLNVPIPVIYVSEDDDGRWIVVDGLQRLNSLRRFFDNEFKLRHLEILDELNGSQFSTLNPKATRLFKNGIIRVIVIKNESHPEIKYDIFQRLNRGAVSLNEQELRNCMYRGSLCALLKQLRKYPPFLQAIGLSAPHKRFYDEELVLRFLAINTAYSPEQGKVIGYPSKMKTFLNRYMENQRNISQEEADRLTNVFKTTIDNVMALIPAPCFRRLKPEDGTLDSRLNRALMDAILIAFSKFDRDFLIQHKDAIIKLNTTLTKTDSQFNDALVFGTSDTKKLELRLNTWYKALSSLGI